MKRMIVILVVSGLTLAAGCDHGATPSQALNQDLSTCEADESIRPHIAHKEIDRCVMRLTPEQAADWQRSTAACHELVSCSEVVTCLEQVPTCPVTITAKGEAGEVAPLIPTTYKESKNPAAGVRISLSGAERKAAAERRAAAARRAAAERRESARPTNRSAMSDQTVAERRAAAARQGTSSRRDQAAGEGRTSRRGCTEICGDVDNDGAVTHRDARKLLEIVGGSANLTVQQRICMAVQSDVNLDLSLDTRDAVDIYAYVNGARSSLRCGR